MTGPEASRRPALRSAVFRREREAAWSALERLVTQAEKAGVDRLPAEELIRLPNLYRTALSALSVARNISLDRALVAYLEGLAARAYLIVHGTRERMAGTIAAFLMSGLPAMVRQLAGPIALAALTMALGVAAGFLLVQADPSWFYSIVSDPLAGGRTPTASAEVLRTSLGMGRKPPLADELAAFASYLFGHNAQISIMAFALGFLFGVPTLVLLTTNGLIIGAMLAVFAGHGLATEFAGWLSIHGVTELTAVVLCGGAGLAIGGAVAFPERRPRLAALAERGRQAAGVVIGGVLMLLVAGILEGFGRQLVVDTGARFAVAAVSAALWIGYFGFAGRRRRRGR